MKTFFLGRILKWAAKKLDGYKTIIGGVSLILTGAVGVINFMFPQEGFPPSDLESSIALIAGGMTAIGIGGKMEKLKDSNKV